MNVQDIPRTDAMTAAGADADRRARRAALAARSSDIPEDVSCRAFRARGARGSGALRARRACRHRRAIVVVPRTSASAGDAEDALRAGAGDAAAWRCSKSSTTTCRSWSIRCSANSTSAASTSACWSIRCSRSSATRPDSSSPSSGERKGRRPARKLHPHPHRRRRPTRRSAPRSSARSKTSSPRCASACRIGGRCWRARASVIAELRTNPPPLPGRRDRRSDPVSRMARRRQFHAARRARLCLHRQRATALEPDVRDRARPVALARHAAAAARQRSS